VWVDAQVGQVGMEVQRCQVLPLYHYILGTTNFFARLKQYRAIATRYDKTARNFLGAIYLAAFVVWLN